MEDIHMAAGETQKEAKAANPTKAKETSKAKFPAKPKAATKPHALHANVHKSHALLQHDRALKKKSPLLAALMLNTVDIAIIN